MLKGRFFLLIFFCLQVVPAFSQNTQIDSLLKVLSTQSDDDTNKVVTLYKLCARYISSDSKKALEYGMKAKELGEQLNFKRGIGSALNNMGIVYENSGDYERAADCYFKSIKIKEELKNLPGLSSAYGNLGEVFDIQGNYEKASYYYEKSLAIAFQLKDTSAMINCYLNIGVVELELDSISQAMHNFRKTVSFCYAIGDSTTLDDAYSNIGVMYENMGNRDSAQYYYTIATIIRERTDDKVGLLNSYNNLGSVNIHLGNYKEAELWYKKSLDLQAIVPSLSSMQTSYHGLAEIYDSIGDFKNANLYYLKYVDVHDSLFNLRSLKQVNAMEIKYQQEKKDKEDKIRKEAEEKQTRITLIFLVTIILVVSGFSVFLYNRFRVIGRQKAVIEVKNKEITDSINYAKRLQDAILPPVKMVQELLPDSFILYRPKDIVAGDFYWVHQDDEKVFFAVADCTGHGVPGAMVSFICSNALDRSVREFGITDPGKILDKVTELLLETFRKSETEVKDGMDISICVMENKTGKLSFAGAHNSLWMVRKEELIILAADNQPVGKYDHLKPFTSHSTSLQKGDLLFLGTDGYSDQFGGEKGKKFKTANLRNLLLANADRPMKEQLETLEKTFDRWKGGLEQVDDVCILGVKI